MKNVKWIDELKLRLGWGMTGQQNGIDDFYYTPKYTISDTYAQYPFGDKYYQTMRPTRYNTELTWEKTTTYNGGLDFTALNGRFGFTIVRLPTFWQQFPLPVVPTLVTIS